MILLFLMATQNVTKFLIFSYIVSQRENIATNISWSASYRWIIKFMLFETPNQSLEVQSTLPNLVRVKYAQIIL